MRSESKLQESYSKQKEVFDLATQRKISTVKRLIEERKAEITRQQAFLTKLETDLKNLEERRFPSFPEFQKRAQDQADKKSP